MPALLGYLIALAVFLGSGYAGLEWLASPDDPTTYQRPNDKTPLPNKNSGPKKSAAGDEGIKAERRGPSTAANADKAGRDEAKATDAGAGGENLKVQKPDAVPTGGCMPIGLTADGEMVFPLQCRELIEHQRGPVAASPPAQGPAPSQDDAQNSGKPNETSGNAFASAPLNPKPSTNGAPVSEPKLAEKNDETKPTSTENSEAAKTLIQKGRNQVASHDVSTTGTVKPSGGRSSADVKTKKIEKLRPAPERSKLVMMTLETIEFPDGHREQRLVPFRRFQRPLAQGDWYNALGLR
jgi:hypothetical protein